MSSKQLIRSVFIILALLILTISNINSIRSEEVPNQVLFINVNIFDGKTNGLKRGMDVLVEGNLIKEISASAIKTNKGATIIDGKGKTLMPGMIINADGSYDVYFGPEAPDGQEHNWVQTVPGKGWNMLFRLYGPLEPWFDKTWRPGDPEVVQ